MSTTTPTPQHDADPHISRPAGTTADAVAHEPGAVVLRTPSAMDQIELRDLAHRLGEVVPEQPVVVAAVAGRVVAGRSLRTGVVVFDGRDAGPAVRDALRGYERTA